MKTPLNIVSLPVDKGGCGWYRIRQPFQMIKAYTEADTYILDTAADPVDHVKALQEAKVCVIRQGGESGINVLKEYPEFKHLKYVLDLDDNVEVMSPYSEHYKEYGTKEFFDPNIQKWIWKDGEQGFDLAHNRKRVLDLLLGIREADLVTVTTPKLAEYAQKFNKNVAVLPNSIDFEQWPRLKVVGEKRLRVGWSGGISHYEDWYTIKKPLNKLLRKHQFKLVIVGSHFTGIVDQDLRHLIEVRPWVPFEAHSWHMACMGIDLALIPLADLPFNHFKSPIKFYEMAALGVPSLTANIGPYTDIPATKGIFYQDEDDFYDKFENLLEYQALRETLADEAYKWVFETQNAKTNASIWVNTYQSLL